MEWQFLAKCTSGYVNGTNIKHISASHDCFGWSHKCSSDGGLWSERFGVLSQLHPGVEEGQHPGAEL